MTALDWVCVAFGILGFSYGIRLWIELRRWAYLIKYTRVVVAYKRKVKLNGTLQEWALWAKAGERAPDKKAGGRTIYTIGGTTIAILRQSFVPDSPIKRLIHKLTRPEGRNVKAGTRAVDGTWTAEDQTEQPTAIKT